MENKHIKMLDDVLNCLCMSGENDYHLCTITQIHDSLMEKGINIGEVNIVFIVRKLQKEGYIELVEVESGKVESCIINFDGKVFKEMGGYSGRFNREKALYLRQNFYDKSLTFLTAVIAVGTVVAALYYLTELYKELDQILPFCQ